MSGRRAASAPVEQVIDSLRRNSGGRVAWSAREPAVAPRFAEPSRPLLPALARSLRTLGIERPYAHQAEAIDAIRSGEDAVIVTPTASGKTLGFTLPIVERLLDEPGTRALYLYPTNALVNDQERGLRTLLDTLSPAPVAGVLTGATDAATRRPMRARPPELLLTNPEMLHMSVLGQHRYWGGFLRGLRFVVIDELHSYRGLFGAHLAMVIRRLVRIAALYGARPQLVACSATIGNPGEMAERVAGRPFRVIEGSGAGRGPRTFMIWRPPLVGTDGMRGDPQSEAVGLFCRLVREGLGTILFALTRRAAETMLMQARERLGPDLGRRIAPYRGGYSPEQRRAVEERLKSGDLLGVVSTNALEVGIDIGGLDAAVIAGFPGSRSSLWQQAGRAGRGARGSLVALVPYERVVDAYYTANPDELLSGRFEDAIIDLNNPRIAASHLTCAAAEQPLDRSDATALSPVAGEALALALRDGRLAGAAGGWTCADGEAHRRVGLRGGFSTLLQIGGEDGELGTIDLPHAYREAHPGAVYLHEGERYRVLRLSADAGRVEVAKAAGTPATAPIVQSTVDVERAAVRRQLAGSRHALILAAGPARLRQTTIGYRELHGRRGQPAKTVALELPLTYEMETSACWLVLPVALRRTFEASDYRRFAGGLHALEHLLPAAVSLRLLCDARDVIATYELEHEAMRGSVLFLLDDCEGGAGIALRAATSFETILRTCFEIVRSCRCRDGCPACILSAACWRQHEGVDKSAATTLLAELVAPA